MTGHWSHLPCLSWSQLVLMPVLAAAQSAWFSMVQYSSTWASTGQYGQGTGANSCNRQEDEKYPATTNTDDDTDSCSRQVLTSHGDGRHGSQSGVVSRTDRYVVESLVGVVSCLLGKTRITRPLHYISNHTTHHDVSNKVHAAECQCPHAYGPHR